MNVHPRIEERIYLYDGGHLFATYELKFLSHRSGRFQYMRISDKKFFRHRRDVEIHPHHQTGGNRFRCRFP